MQNDLFSSIAPEMEKIADGVHYFRNYVDGDLFFEQIMEVARIIPFRHMVTPGGKRINVAGTSMGDAGWYSDRRGYRYEKSDPLSGKDWPPIPKNINHIISEAAAKAGYENFNADSCFINRYQPGVQLTQHQDQDEQDFSQPIVSVSLGVSAIFQLYGDIRGGTAYNIPLHHCDLLIFGGPARKYFHSVKKLKPDNHPLTGDKRYNLTFRKAF